MQNNYVSQTEMESEEKGKGHPKTCHEDPERECRYSSTVSLTSALNFVGSQRHAPAALPLAERRGTDCTEWATIAQSV